MGRPPGTPHLPLYLCLTLLPWVPVPASGQSPPPPDYLLKVVSAKYLPEKDAVEYRLVNHGPNPVTAFSVTISVEVDGRDAFRDGGPISNSRDLLGPELLLQCKDFPENAAKEGASPFPDMLPPQGTIKPGDTLAKSISGELLDASMLQSGSPKIHVDVTGIMWADGTIEGTTGVGDMKRIRDWRQEADREEKSVLAVLSAHADDENTQHQINDATKDLRSLMEGYPREVKAPEDEPHQTLRLQTQSYAEMMIGNLDEAAYQPYPGERYTFLREFVACMHDRRHELQEVKPAVPAKSQHQSRRSTCIRSF
jgi:hypothetical protein